jgi:WD40 repeat protein
MNIRPGWLALSFCLVDSLTVLADTTTADLYQQRCGVCHGADRLGVTGPALLPQNLHRLKQQAAVQIITHGAPATQMPAFKDKLTTADIEALAEYIFQPLDHVPQWGLEQINASHVLAALSDNDVAQPVFDADPLNLFVVVETGDHHVTILDGDLFEPIHRFKSRRALHGGPKFTSDGRYVYFASRDGWISKFDLYTLKTVAEVRAGINTRNLAVSGDNRYVAVGNYLPHNLVILDAENLKPIKIIAVDDGNGNSSRVSAVYDASPRQSFIAALKDITEVWEISYEDDPPYYGKVHDYRYEGPPENIGRFPVRRIKLDDYLDDFFFDQDYNHLVGAGRNANNGQVVNLIVGRKIADIDLAGLPHLGSGITWRQNGSTLLATPHLKEAAVTVIDTNNWQTIKKIETLGPGFFMRSHKNSDYAWVDVFFGPNKDAVHVIDKNTLEIVKTLRPQPGKTAAHVEFTSDGRHALLSIWDMDGALVVYDAKTLQEVKRIPMVKPSGKYNVYNKITKEEGTSH